MGRYSKIITLFIIMICIFIGMSIILPDKFLTLPNFQSMGNQIPEFGLLVFCIMFAMLTGGIDLSIISITNLSGVITAIILKSFVTTNMGDEQTIIVIALAILAGIVVSLLCGLINGLLIAYAGVTPILATLGTGGFFLGTSIIITKGHGITGFPDKFQFIGNGTILKVPFPIIIFIIIILVISLVLNKTTLGFSIRMLGSNHIAARFAGVNNENVLMKTYIISGLLAGIASIILISRVNSISPNYGAVYLFAAILVVILAGVNPYGGQGSVIGIVIALLILQMLSSGFNILNFSPFIKKFIWGTMLLSIMVLNFIVNKQHQRIIKSKRRPSKS